MTRQQHGTTTDDAALEAQTLEGALEARRSAAETWLLVGAIAMIVVGVALIVLPTAAPRYGWIVRSLAARGVTSLPIAIGGVLMSGLSFAIRSARTGLVAALEASSQTSPAVEELAQQVAHLGDGLQGLRIEFVYLKDSLQSQLERVQTAGGSDSAGDAVYRLAASLDQVGMRIEERLNAEQRRLAETLQGISTALETLRDESARVRARLEDPASAGYPTSDAAYADGWTSEDDPRPARLGLLDMLDDLGRLLPHKAVPVDEGPEIEPDPFEGVQDEGWKQSSSVPAPLPKLRGDELRLAEPIELLGRDLPRVPSPSADPGLGDKLEELRGLLADERVREALSALERTRR